MSLIKDSLCTNFLWILMCDVQCSGPCGLAVKKYTIITDWEPSLATATFDCLCGSLYNYKAEVGRTECLQFDDCICMMCTATSELIDRQLSPRSTVSKGINTGNSC